MKYSKELEILRMENRVRYLQSKPVVNANLIRKANRQLRKARKS